MKVKAVRVGDEIAVLLPRELVVRLGLAEGQFVHAVLLSDGSVRIGQSDPVFDEGMRIAEEVMEECAETFAALAKE
jgi:antitoxin component of MazEF toxin-antitoxin module